MVRRLLARSALIATVALGACSGSAGVPVQPIRGAGPAPTPTPTSIPTATPTAVITAVPSSTPTAKPIATPTPTPVLTATPTPLPTATPSSNPAATQCSTNDSPVDKPFASVECAVSTVTNPQEQVNFTLDNSNNTAGTYPALSFTGTFSQANPGAFSVPGTVIFSAQATLHATPATLSISQPNGLINIGVDYGFSLGSASNNINPSVGFTCSVFDGPRLISQAYASNSSQDLVGCEDVYPAGSEGAPGANFAVTVIPNAINVGDVYTFIISQ